MPTLIEKMSNDTGTVDRLFQFGQIRGHRRVRVQLALVGENSRDRSGNRLADREYQMLRRGRETMRVPLRNDLAAMQDQEAIGVACAQGICDRCLFTLAIVKGDGFEMAPRQRQNGRRIGAGDVGGGKQFPDIAKPPLVERLLTPVRKSDRCVACWKMRHDSDELADR